MNNERSSLLHRKQGPRDGHGVGGTIVEWTADERRLALQWAMRQADQPDYACWVRPVRHDHGSRCCTSSAPGSADHGNGFERPPGGVVWGVRWRCRMR